MPDPFLVPDEPTAAEAIAAISEELEVFDDWMERYGYIIELGRKLPPFPQDWQNDSHRVPGCQSQVWMEADMRDGRMMLAGASDAGIPLPECAVARLRDNGDYAKPARSRPTGCLTSAADGLPAPDARLRSCPPTQLRSPAA